MKTTSLVTREDVLSVPLPDRTATYTPVANYDLIHAILTISQDYGMRIASEDYRLTTNGNAMVSTFRMERIGNADIGTMIAGLNSYDKSKRISVASGGNVFICMNGMILGEHVFQNRHVGSIDEDLFELVDDTIAGAVRDLDILNEHASLMRDVRISSLDMAHVLGEMFFEHSMLTTQQLNIVKKQIKVSDNFKMVDKDDMNVWNFYNNITEALKVSHPHNYIKDHVKVHDFVTNAFEIVNVEEENIDFAEILTP